MLCNSQAATRGRILSLYMITFYASEACGQLLINLGNLEHILLYAIAAMLCSLAVIPLSITRAPMPQFDQASSMSLRELYQQATSSFFGCFFAGMVLSASYGLLPILFWNLYHDTSEVSVLMFCLIFGGMILQYPVGKLSDLIERRLVVILICVLSIITSLLLMRSVLPYPLLLIAITLFGGLITTIYPICISYACDNLDNHNIVAGIQGLLLSYSIGATLGPFIAPFFMHSPHERGLFVYLILMFCITAAIFAWRTTQKISPPQEEPFQLMRHSTSVMAQIDPRVDQDPMP